jgi:coenzyme Q-binding protein COQ10
MRTVDVVEIGAGPDEVYAAARAVERWPDFLPHYRWVRFLPDGAGPRLVEMAAWRPFGPFRWPTWWVSEMWIDPARREVRYRHVRGITRGMEVCWRVTDHPTGARAEIVHEWTGPGWPLIGGTAASWVIGPVFVHGIASRTLAGIRKRVESRHG